EMKSSRIGRKQFDRRLRLLADLQSLEFHYRAIIVDKRALDPESGYRYRPSFVKNLTGLIYDDIFRWYPGAEVRADEYGSPEFRETHLKYLERRGQHSLFPPCVEFVDSR